MTFLTGLIALVSVFTMLAASYLRQFDQMLMDESNFMAHEADFLRILGKLI